MTDNRVMDLERELAEAREVIENICGGYACLPGYSLTDAISECTRYLSRFDPEPDTPTSKE